MEEIKTEFLKGIIGIEEAVEKEREMRLKNAKTHCEFGMSYFDDSLSGIYPNDLVLIGAESGAGKTEFATQIAYYNAIKGKRVAYFALEAEQYEIERRIKYRYLSDYFFKFRNRVEDFKGMKLNYQDWYYGKLDPIMADHEALLNTIIVKQLAGLKTFYRTYGEFTATDFQKYVFAMKDEVDLIIVDHLHYFDSDEPNENKAMKEITKKLRDCALLLSKPIVLVAHLRKKDKKQRRLISDLDDFHGTSDIGKIATKAVTLAPAYDMQAEGTRFPTYFRATKFRVSNANTRPVGWGYFDIATNRYEDKYTIGEVNEFEQEFKPFEPQRVPHWATHALNQARPDPAPILRPAAVQNPPKSPPRPHYTDRIEKDEEDFFDR